jgi:3-hydroxy-9,10-secoandrosta-1,3,5(10)-triene-9,17-dione monooxygenase
VAEPVRSLPSTADDDEPERHRALLERARALVPALRERASRVEELRRLPSETERDLHESGLYRMLQPRRLGGAELDFGALIDIGAEIARGCASTAWNLTNLASHHWMLAMFPPEAQDRVWGEDPDVLMASSFVFPAGKATAVPGGYRLSGRWPFSSGVGPSAWNMLGGTVAPGSGPPELRLFLLPKSDYAVIDNWHAMGLRGTGSNDVVCEDAFVPAAMTIAVEETKGGPTPGAGRNPAALYRLPVFALFPLILSGIGLGNAEAMLEDYVATTRARTSHYSATRLAGLQSTHIKIGAAAGRIAVARRTMLGICAEAMADARAGRVPDLETKLAYRRDTALATALCTEAVDLLYAASGAHGLYTAGVAQRLFRDAHAVAAHIAFNMDVAAAAHGRVALGLDADNATV